MNIVFMGTPDFSVPTLEALIEAGHNILAVVTQPDKPKGRKGTPVFSPVKEVAVKHDIKVLQPERIKDEENVQILRGLKPDVMVVVAFGQILSKEILDIAPYGCINVHASLLPEWRGAAPIQWSIITGQKETGVTIMQMDEGLDTGDILYVKKVPISEEETGGSLFDKLKDIGAAALIEVLPKIVKGEVTPVKQGDSTTPYAKMLKKSMGLLDFNDTVFNLNNRIRGLSPWPGTFTHFNGKTLKIWKAKDIKATDILEEDILCINKDMEAYPVGALYVYENMMIVKCADGFLKLLEVQLEGKKRMDAETFLRGVRIKEVVVLGSDN